MKNIQQDKAIFMAYINRLEQDLIEHGDMEDSLILFKLMKSQLEKSFDKYEQDYNKLFLSCGTLLKAKEDRINYLKEALDKTQNVNELKLSTAPLSTCLSIASALT